jgi:2-polyprenyl-3-methyl-5-hydroxy-6-metoxy-1,4-benzoquinol methylase
MEGMEKDKLDYSRHYRNWHSDEENHIQKMVDFYDKRIIPLIPANKQIKILDIGCGMGFLLMALKKNGYTEAVGIDSDMTQVASCEAKNLQVIYSADTIQYLHEHAEGYDLITAFDVIEHIPAELQVKFIRSIFQSLKAHGRCLLTTPNATSFLGMHNRYLDYTHQSLFTTVSLDFILYNGGFRKIEIRPFEYIRFNNSIKSLAHRFLFKTFRMIRRLQFIAELGTVWGKKVPLSFNLIALAEKDQEA